MGDLIHALPALTDASEAFPGLEADWVVDESFAEVPSWHRNVNNIYTSAHRRWRKDFFNSFKNREFGNFYRQINHNNYDAIIDAQNNIKSAFVTILRKGKVHGMDAVSVAESPAHLAYAFRHGIEKNQHAIARQRQLFSAALEYEIPHRPLDFGLKPGAFTTKYEGLPERFIFLVHNASWTTKLWPEAHWHALIETINNNGFSVVVPNGNQQEYERARRIAGQHNNAVALPKLPLTTIGSILDKAAGAVCCDTGLCHMAAMIGTPAVSLYGPTSEKLIGATGKNQVHLVASDSEFPCAPCYQHRCTFNGKSEEISACMTSFTPEQVWKGLHDKIVSAV